MAVFALRTLDHSAVDEWVYASMQRGKHLPIARNPYEWRFKKVKKKDSLFVVCEVKPLVPPFYLGGWIAGAGVFLVWGYHWVLWPCVVVGMLGYFWTGEFFYQMSRLALRKAGYKGSIKRIKLSELVREVVL